MTIETIDNVLYYVWRAGDELPKYKPIGCKFKYKEGNEFYDVVCAPTGCSDWNDFYESVIWSKLLNDRAQHQRMIDEAYETALDSDTYAFIQRHNQLAYMHTQSGNKQYALQHLSLAGAYVKRMMEYVQEQIDKEGEKV